MTASTRQGAGGAPPSVVSKGASGRNTLARLPVRTSRSMTDNSTEPAMVALRSSILCWLLFAYRCRCV